MTPRFLIRSFPTVSSAIVFLVWASLLSDLEGPRHPKFPVMERTLGLLHSFMEKNLTRSLISLFNVSRASDS
ncbi:predicted protein [Arabidopsis lyrata subsp. lyrata]|uniref:Predicted protein n=1 Tax=Arabidopsis lyrata subsp. lyrata TaxID=81972 RepID=D7LNP8_ARALL|nr:predicted protein [Arabidopsis lyrata subsp. lyrata]